jgi:hypothetical protein
LLTILWNVLALCEVRPRRDTLGVSIIPLSLFLYIIMIKYGRSQGEVCSCGFVAKLAGSAGDATRASALAAAGISILVVVTAFVSTLCFGDALILVLQWFVEDAVDLVHGLLGVQGHCSFWSRLFPPDLWLDRRVQDGLD